MSVAVWAALAPVSRLSPLPRVLVMEEIEKTSEEKEPSAVETALPC
jgi:hypothetical protein